MDVRQKRNEALGKRVVKALESRNMEAYYAATKEEAVKKALELIPEGSSINMGGSMSVREVGLLDAINSGNYEFYDRDKAATPEEKQEIALKDNKLILEFLLRRDEAGARHAMSIHMRHLIQTLHEA